VRKRTQPGSGKICIARLHLTATVWAQPGLEVEMNIIVAIIGVVLPTLIVGLFAYFAYLTEGAERERR